MEVQRRDTRAPIRRHGIERARTGCITCKARKVKCDEHWPDCVRCQKSGRKCAGYKVAPVGSFSWSHLLGARPSLLPFTTTTTPSVDLRGLDFFRSVVAPKLAGPSRRRFWTRSVLQLATQETFTRHAVLAISSLYEHFDGAQHDDLAADRQGEAVKNYNKALRQIYLSKHLDTNVVLLASILFTCIEFLRGNTDSAINHCRHGTRLINNHGADSEILGLFYHLSIFPHFFGATLADFPSLPELPRVDCGFSSIIEAQDSMDRLMSRTVRLLGSFHPYRMNMVGVLELPSDLHYAQLALCQDLTSWMTEFRGLKDLCKPDESDEAMLRLLEMRWFVCQIWAESASCHDETVYDAYLDQFTRIIELAQGELASRIVHKDSRSECFSFEMEFAPLLQFVILKCRYLRLRLQALSQLRLLAKPREAMWDTNVLHAQGRRIIEYEHRMQLTNACLEGENPKFELPSDLQRIRDSRLDERRYEGTDEDGPVIFQGICFFVCDTEERSVRQVQDWIKIVKEPKHISLAS